MARNEIEVSFGKTQKRHQAEAYRLSMIGTEALGRGDLEESDRIDKLVGIEKGRIRFLQGFVIEVLTKLKSEGINIPEVELEESAPLQVETPPSPGTPQTFKAFEEIIPGILTTPDGTELGGHSGKLLAFLAHQGTPKSRAESARHVYDKDDKASVNRVTALISYLRSPESAASQHGVKIQTEEPSAKEKQLGVKARDRIVFVSEPVAKTATLVPEVATIEEAGAVKVSLQLQAATLSNMLLEAREKLHTLGVELTPGDIRELEKIRQKIAGVDPGVRSRALEASRQLVVRFLADPAVVYDELAGNPEGGGEDCQLALAPLTSLSKSGEEVVDQLFAEYT